MKKVYFEFKDYSICSVTTLSGEEMDDKFAIELTQEHEPMEVLDYITNEKKIVTSSSFVIGMLEWNSKEEAFEFKSVGLRYLEYGTEELSELIIKFAELEQAKRRILSE